MIVQPRDRVEAIQWARDLQDDERVVYLDTETTGLGKSAEIVDIAILGYDGQVLLDTLVRPSGRIPADATAVHGITDRHVARAPFWEEIAWPVWDLLSERIVVVYNASFDRAMVHQCCERWGTATIEAHWRCAMRAYAAFRAGIGGASSRWHKLPDAARSFAIPPGGHRALGDAEACRAVVAAMARGGR